jgi:hypothetical protein
MCSLIMFLGEDSEPNFQVDPASGKRGGFKGGGAC